MRPEREFRKLYIRSESDFWKDNTTGVSAHRIFPAPSVGSSPSLISSLLILVQNPWIFMASPPCSCEYSWTKVEFMAVPLDETSEPRKSCTGQMISVILQVEEALFHHVVTDFGTIREDRSRLGGYGIRQRTITFDLLDRDDESTLRAAVDRAFSDMRVFPNASSEALQRWAPVFVLDLVHRHVADYGPKDYGLEFRVYIEEKRVMKIEVGGDAWWWLRRYVRTEVYGGSGGAAAEEEDTSCCPICLNEFRAGKKIGRTDCGHVFHTSCICRWFCKSLSCPMCRSHLPPGSI